MASIRQTFTDIADAIRSKNGSTSKMKPTQMASLIESLPMGIAGCDELYSNDAVSITYTSTSAGTAKTITGITNIAKYPFIIVIIENTNATAGTLKFIRSATVISNLNFAAGSVSAMRYGVQQYYPSSGTLAQISSTSYGLWGYTISTSANGSLTIRGSCNKSYYTSLTGTYKIKVLGVRL